MHFSVTFTQNYSSTFMCILYLNPKNLLFYPLRPLPMEKKPVTHIAFLHSIMYFWLEYVVSTSLYTLGYFQIPLCHRQVSFSLCF